MFSRFFRRSTSILGLASFVALTACGGGSTTPSLAPQDNTSAQTPVAGSVPTTTSGVVASSLAVGSGDRVAPTSVVKAHPFLAHNLHGSLAPQSVVYPGDLTYFGGPVLANARVFNAFVNSTATPFGTPNVFEEHLSYSKMIHIADQYVGATTNNRYDWAGDAKISFPAYTTLGDNDLLAILHAVAKGLGPNAGRKNVYNVFLPQGLNYCGTGTIMPNGDCNASSTSPNPYFCAFHGAVVFGDVGEVLYTLEPYQDQAYCAVNFRSGAATPNGVQNDSTYSTLSHELFETITDPEPGSGWYDNNAPAVSGEIGDLCAYLAEDVTLANKSYYVQREYSNRVHGCDDLQ